jgi:GDSL-like Lipase/Acylhydrolase family
MKPASILMTGALMLMATALQAQTPAFPVPGNPADMGKGIQRTMTLLATSTPQKHHKVKILVYGQSISEQGWWELVKQDLQKRFPDADLQMDNLAIGGFASQLLSKIYVHDVLPYYPDLVIFHVYGGDNEYREIIHGIRTQTAAEVLIQKDHVAATWPNPQATFETDRGAWWDQHMNNHVLPEAASKYRCGLVDIRKGWMEYLQANHLEPQARLKDGVHLNDEGCKLMAGLIDQYLVYRPDLPQATWKDLVNETPVTDGLWKQGELTVEFTGNRVDLVAAAGEGHAEVRIDGKRPSEFPGCYYIARPAPRAWAPLAVIRVDHDTPLQVEDWTLTITKVSDDKKIWEYDVAGSVTGPDGHGSNAAVFRSNSGRAIIAPDGYYRAGGDLTPGYKVTWSVRQITSDSYTAPAKVDPTRETTVTLAQGIPVGKHTLTLKSASGKPVPLATVRAYLPAEHP